MNKNKKGELKMNVVYAIESVKEVPKKSIFLAGPSPRRDTDTNWRPEALKGLEKAGFTGTVFVPLPRPRGGKWPKDYTDQVGWELEYLKKALVVMFWVPRDLESLPAFTTNVEFGMYVDSGKIVFGFPEWAPKMKYLEYVAKSKGVSVFSTLDDTIGGAIALVESLE